MPDEAQYLVIPTEGTYSTIMLIAIYGKWYKQNWILRYSIKELSSV
jgi:hypothetical protein